MNNLNLEIFSIEDINKLKGFDGFITQDGKFLKVRKRGDKNNKHEVFAQIYCKKLYDTDPLVEYQKIKEVRDLVDNNCYKDCFINMYGVVDYMYKDNRLVISVPNKRINGYSVTDKQIDFIVKLARLNNDKLNISSMFIYDDINEYELYKIKKL